jgi:hypothetical protein
MNPEPRAPSSIADAELLISAVTRAAVKLSASHDA